LHYLAIDNNGNLKVSYPNNFTQWQSVIINNINANAPVKFIDVVSNGIGAIALTDKRYIYFTFDSFNWHEYDLGEDYLFHNINSFQKMKTPIPINL